MAAAIKKDEEETMSVSAEAAAKETEFDARLAELADMLLKVLQSTKLGQWKSRLQHALTTVKGEHNASPSKGNGSSKT